MLNRGKKQGLTSGLSLLPGFGGFEWSVSFSPSVASSLYPPAVRQSPRLWDPHCSLKSRLPKVTPANTHRAFKRMGKGIFKRDYLFLSKGLTQPGSGGDFWDVISPCGTLMGLPWEWRRPFSELFFSKDLSQLRVRLFPVILLPVYFSPFQSLYSQLRGNNMEETQKDCTRRSLTKWFLSLWSKQETVTQFFPKAILKKAEQCDTSNAKWDIFGLKSHCFKPPSYFPCLQWETWVG